MRIQANESLPLATPIDLNQELLPCRLRLPPKKAHQLGFDETGVLMNNFK